MKPVLPLVFLMAAMSAAAFDFSPMPVIKVEAASLGGLSSLSVRCDIRGASVWVDNQYRGTAPLDMTGLSAGSHLLILRLDGYYDAAIQLSLAADTKTTVTTSLAMRTGFLNVAVDPSDATVAVDGKSYAPGTIEVQAGQRSVVISAFGYEEREFSVYVPERMFASLTATLEPAPFEATGFSVSTARFNPLNSGLRGALRASFTVSAAGYAHMTVTGPEGEQAAALELGPFDTWSQSFSWDGRGDDGAPLPDGAYSIRVWARPAEGVESYRDEYGFDATAIIDSSLIIVPVGAYGAIPGSLFAPDALPPADDGFRIEAGGFASTPLGASAAGATGYAAMAVSLSLKGLLDAGAGLEFMSTNTAAGLLGFRISAPLPSPFGAAIVAEGRISDATPDNAAYARLGAAMGLGTRFFNAVAMPTIGAYWEGGFSARAGLNAAVSVSGFRVGAALSACASTLSLAQGFSIDWPIRSALELRLAPAGLPLSFRVLGGLDWSPLPTSWFAGLALSGGL